MSDAISKLPAVGSLEQLSPPVGSLLSRVLASARRNSRELALAVIVVLICLVASLLLPSFAHLDNIVGLAASGCILLLAAVGQVGVVLTKNIDLSIGSVIGLCGYLTADMMSKNPNLPLLVTALVAIAIGVVMGAVNGVAVGLQIGRASCRERV